MNFVKSALAICTLILCSYLACTQYRSLIRFSGTDDGSESLEQLLQEFQEGAQIRLDRHIEAFTRVCQLNEAQERKLDVAARGTIYKFLAQRRIDETVRLRRYQERAGFKFDENGLIQVNKEDPGKIRKFAFSISLPSPIFVDESKFWKRSIDKVLTDEQKQTWSEFQSERENRLRDSAIGVFVARAEYRLLLTEEQTTKLRERIANDPLADKLKQMVYQQTVVQHFRLRHKSEIKDFEFHHLVDGILNEEQIRQWKVAYEPELQNIDAELKRLKSLAVPFGVQVN